MAYRANVTDKQQNDMERAAEDSAIRVQWWKSSDGQTQTNATTKNIPAYDLQAQSDAGGSPNDAVLANNRAQMTVGSHNDQPHRFVEPGKA